MIELFYARSEEARLRSSSPKTELSFFPKSAASILDKILYSCFMTLCFACYLAFIKSEASWRTCEILRGEVFTSLSIIIVSSLFLAVLRFTWGTSLKSRLNKDWREKGNLDLRTRLHA